MKPTRLAACLAVSSLALHAVAGAAADNKPSTVGSITRNNGLVSNRVVQVVTPTILRVTTSKPLAANPRDFAALSRPGLQPQEGAKPFLALSGKIDLSSAASLEIFYQLLSATSTQPGCGTFAATADYASPGCDRVMVSNALSSADGLGTGRFLKRGSDGTAGDAGQFGIGGSYLVPDIGTKFSLHFTNIHARTGYVEADRTGRSGAIFLPGDPDGLNPAYRFRRR